MAVLTSNHNLCFLSSNFCSKDRSWVSVHYGGSNEFKKAIGPMGIQSDSETCSGVHFWHAPIDNLFEIQ